MKRVFILSILILFIKLLLLVLYRLERRSYFLIDVKGGGLTSSRGWPILLPLSIRKIPIWWLCKKSITVPYILMMII